MIGIKDEQIAGMNQHYMKYSFDCFLKAQQKLGMKNIELWLGPPHFWLDSVTYSDCRTVVKKISNYGLKVVSVTSPSFAWQYQYAPQREYEFEKSFKYFSNGICVTAEMGAKIMTINSGWGYWNSTSDRAFECSVRMISRLADVAQREGITLVMESLTSDESNIVYNIDTAKQMFETVAHPALKIMVDTVAIRFAGETLAQWFETFDKDLVHMHFTDSDTQNPSDEHLVWGDGNTLLEKEIACLNNYGYNGYLVQEIIADRYLDEPILADMQNMKRLQGFLIN